MNRRYLVIGILALGIMGLVIFSIVNLISQKDTIPVQIYIVPDSAIVKIDNKKYSNNSTAHLKAGVYNVVSTKDGFNENSITFNVNTTDSSPTINIALYPSSASATDWYNQNQNLYLQFEGREGTIANKNGDDFAKINPITAYLPIQKAIYTIGYKNDPSQGINGIIVTIKAYNGYREPALQEIRDKGINPSDYKIEFVDYKDPF